MIGGQDCPITAQNDTHINCSAPGLPGGTYSPVATTETGYSSTSVSAEFALAIDTVDTPSGSGKFAKLDYCSFKRLSQDSKRNFYPKFCYSISLYTHSIIKFNLYKIKLNITFDHDIFSYNIAISRKSIQI